MHSYPVFMLNSFSRSGETMLLRALAAHPLIRVAHDLAAQNTNHERRLVGRVRFGGAVAITADDPVLGPTPPPKGAIIVVKNAVWTPEFPCPSFVLARNPFSSILSIGAVDLAKEEALARRWPPVALWKKGPWQKPSPLSLEVREKLSRWSRDIDLMMKPHVTSADAVTGAALLYARKMQNAYDIGGPILRYEDIIKNPEAALRKLIAHFGLPWDDMVLRSHERYKQGEIGHGGIKLWEPMNDRSLDKYRTIPTAEFDKIYAITAAVMQKFGYSVDQNRTVVVGELDDRFGPVLSAAAPMVATAV